MLLLQFFEKLNIPYYCFHDIDVSPEGESIKEYIENFARMTDVLEQKQQEIGLQLLWGTANAFSNPRYQSGASTSPDPEVFAYAATQVFTAMNATKQRRLLTVSKYIRMPTFQYHILCKNQELTVCSFLLFLHQTLELKVKLTPFVSSFLLMFQVQRPVFQGTVLK